MSAFDDLTKLTGYKQPEAEPEQNQESSAFNDLAKLTGYKSPSQQAEHDAALENIEAEKQAADKALEPLNVIKGTAAELGERAKTSVGGAFGAIGAFPTYAKQAAANAIEGGHPYDDTDSFLDRWRKEGKEKAQEAAADPDSEKPGLFNIAGETGKTWDTVAQSLPYSALVDVPVYAGALMTPATGGASIIGGKAAQAAGVATMFQATKGEFVSDKLDKFIENHKAENNGQEPTRDAILAEQERLQPFANEYAAYEVGMEFAGSKLGAKALGMAKNIPASSAAGQFLATKTGKAVGFMGSQAVTELPSETETQLGQHNVDVESGYADKNDNKPREWTSFEDQSKSFNEVKDSVLAQSLLMGGAIHLGTMAKALVSSPTVAPPTTETQPPTPEQLAEQQAQVRAERETKYTAQNTRWNPTSDDTLIDDNGEKLTVSEYRNKLSEHNATAAPEAQVDINAQINAKTAPFNPEIKTTGIDTLTNADDLYQELTNDTTTSATLSPEQAREVVAAHIEESKKPDDQRRILPLPTVASEDVANYEAHGAKAGAANAGRQKSSQSINDLNSRLISPDIDYTNPETVKQLNAVRKQIEDIKKIIPQQSAVEQQATADQNKSATNLSNQGKQISTVATDYNAAVKHIKDSIAAEPALTTGNFEVQSNDGQFVVVKNSQPKVTDTQQKTDRPAPAIINPSDILNAEQQTLREFSDKTDFHTTGTPEDIANIKAKVESLPNAENIDIQVVDNGDNTHTLTSEKKDTSALKQNQDQQEQSTQTTEQAGESALEQNQPPKIKSKEQQIKDAFESMGEGFAKAGENKLIDDVKNNGEATFKVKESTDIIKSRPDKYNFRENDDGSVTVLGVKTDDGWVGIESKTEDTTNGKSQNETEAPAKTEAEIKVGDSVFLRDGTTGKVEKITGKLARVIDQAGTGHILKLSDLKANKSVFDRAKRDPEAEKTALQSTFTGDEMQAEKTNVDAKGLKTFSESSVIKALDISEEKAKATDELLELWSQASINKKQAELEESAYLKKLDSLANQPDSGVTSVINENGTVTYTVTDESGLRVGEFTRGKSSATLERLERGEYNKIHQEALKAGVGRFEVDRYKMTVQPLKDVVVDKLKESAKAKAESLSPGQLIIEAKKAKQKFNYFKEVIARLRSLFHELFRTVNPANFAQDDKISYSFVNADRSVMFILAKGRGDFVWNENLTAEQEALKQGFEQRIADLQRTIREGELSTEALEKNNGKTITSDVTELVQGNEILSQLFENYDSFKKDVDFSGFAASTEGGVGAVKETIPPKPKIDSDKAKSPHDAKLPSGLSGAKPNYSYGAKQFRLDFESDLDKAAYIAAKQENRSSRDADYVDFVKNLTGWHEDFVRAHGRVIRSAIKEMAKNGEHGETLFIAKQPIKTSSEMTGGVVKPKIDPGTGKISKVKTAKGNEVETRFKVISADDLVVSHDHVTGNENRDYPSELQPRDRTKEESRLWVVKNSKNLDVDELAGSRSASKGAPIVGDDAVVESGNGRSMLVREAYRTGNAEEYRAWLLENSDQFGINAKDIEGIENPILIRVRTTPMDNEERAKFTKEANKSDLMGVSATEQARADATLIDADMISKLSANSDLDSKENIGFIDAFLNSLTDAERATYRTTSGGLTKQIYDRVQNAIFSKAYNDDRLLELLADESKVEIKNIIFALNAAAPQFIQAKAVSEESHKHASGKLTSGIEMSLDQKAIKILLDSVNVILDAKNTGNQVIEQLNQVNIPGFGDDYTPTVKALGILIAENKTKPAQLARLFTEFGIAINKALVAGDNLFGLDELGLMDVIRAAADSMSRGKASIERTEKSGKTIAQISKLLSDRFKAVKRLIAGNKLDIVQSIEDLPKHLQDVGRLLAHAVWHGSPHDFDRFDNSFAQEGDYGFGFYFNNTKNVADDYAKLRARNGTNPVTYEVDLKSKEEDYLILDKPFSQQSQKIQAILKDIGIDFGSGRMIYDDLKESKNLAKLQGKDWVVGGAKKASAFLLSKGIKGLKYYYGNKKDLDTYNYVIFSDSDISITAKYSRDLSGMSGIFDPATGKTYLVADMLDENNLVSVFLHEMLHRIFAINPQLKAKLLAHNGKLARIEQLIKKGLYKGRYKAIYEAALARVPGITDPADTLEEFAAYTVSEFNRAPESLPEQLKVWAQKLIAIIKNALVRFGIPFNQVSPADLDLFARQAVNIDISAQAAGERAKRSFDLFTQSRGEAKKTKPQELAPVSANEKEGKSITEWDDAIATVELLRDQVGDESVNAMTKAMRENKAKEYPETALENTSQSVTDGVNSTAKPQAVKNQEDSPYHDFLVKSKLKPLNNGSDYRIGDENGKPFRKESFAQDAIDRNGLTDTHIPFYNGGVYEINPKMESWEWENLKQDYSNSITSKKESGEPIIRFLNGAFYKEKIEKLYDNEKPVKGDVFVDKDKALWTITNVQDVQSLGYKNALFDTVASVVSSTGKKSQLQINKRWYQPEQATVSEQKNDLLTSPTKAEVLQRQEEQAALAKKEATDKVKAEQKRKAYLEVDTLADEMMGTGGTTTMDIFAQNNGIRFSKLIEPEVKNLVILHNTSLEGLENYNKEGRVPSPSLAISRTEHPLANFGEISLIGGTENFAPDRTNKIFNADVYSARYPRISYIPNEKEIKRLNASFFSKEALELKDYGNVLQGNDLENSQGLISYLQDNPPVIYEYLVSKGITPKIVYEESNVDKYKTKREMESLITDKRDYHQWIENAFGDIVKSEKIFTGYTYSGARKYTEHNIDNVLKIMKKQGIRGAEGFNFGVPSVRAQVAIEYKKLKDIQKDREKIVSKEEMEKLAKVTIDEYSRIESELRNTTDIYASNTDNFLEDSAKRGISWAENEYSIKLDDTLKKDITALFSLLREYPTEYFEIKPQRIVNLSEFSGAVIPEGKEYDRAVEILKRYGITDIRRYKGEAERANAINEFSHLHFSKTTPTQNPHTTKSLLATFTKQLDSKFGSGWTGRLLATGKFKVITRAEMEKLLSGNSSNLEGMINSSTSNADNLRNLADIQSFVEQFNSLIKIPRQSANGSVNPPDLKGIANANIRNSDLSGNIANTLSRIKEANGSINIPKNTKLWSSLVDVISNQISPDAVLMDVKFIANVLKTESFVKHGFSNLSIETKNAMLQKMVSATKNSEVFNSIVGLIPVNMMNVLGNEKLTPDMLLHNKPMLLDALTSNGVFSGNISLMDSVNLAEVIALAITKNSILSFSDLAKEFSNGFSTSRTGTVNHISLKSNSSQDGYYTIDSGNAQAFYNPLNDTTYFVADNISQDKDLVGLALHEIATHQLLLNKNNPEFQALIENLAKSAFRPAVREAIDTALKSFGLKAIPKAGQPIDGVSREDVLHEVAAYLVEKNPQLSISQKIIQWFRNAIRALGKNLPILERAKWFKDVAAINEADIIEMATSALRGAPESLLFDDVGRNGDIQFSKLTTGEENAYIRATNDTLRRYGHNLKLIPAKADNMSVALDANDRGREVNAPTTKRTHRKVAEAIAGIFGKNIIWVRTEGDFTINGMVTPKTQPDAIYIDINSKIYAHVVMGHELNHHIAAQHPEIYQELLNETKRLFKNTDRYTAINQLQGAQGEYIQEEMLGDTLGDAFGDSEFWNELGKKKPSLLSRVASIITRWLNNLIGESNKRGFGSEQWVTDAKAMRSALANAVAKYSAAEGVSVSGIEEARFSAQKAERFYSALRKGVEKAPNQAFAGATQFKLWLAGNAPKMDIKKDEIYWSGINDWLDMQGKTKITRDDVLNFLDENGVKVEDVVLPRTKVLEADALKLVALKREKKQTVELAREIISKTNLISIARDLENYEDKYKHPKYLIEDAISSLRGSQYISDENYKALKKSYSDVLEIDEKIKSLKNKAGTIKAKHGENQGDGSLVLPNGKNYRELVVTIPAVESFNESDETHFGDVGKGKQIAWLRTNERTDDKGNLGLFLEEVQSQRVAQGKEKGFSAANNAQPTWIQENNAQPTWIQEGDIYTLKSDSVTIKIDKESENQFYVYEPNGVLGRSVASLTEAKEIGLSEFKKGSSRAIPPAPFISQQQQAISFKNKLTGLWDVQYGSKEIEKGGKKFKVPNVVASFDNETKAKQLAMDYTQKNNLIATDAYILLLMKKALSAAIDNGQSFVSWTTGEQQADRYSLDKSLKSIKIDVNPASEFIDGYKNINLVPIDGGDSIYLRVDDKGLIDETSDDFVGKNLADVIGKDMADKINAMTESQTLKGENLKIQSGWTRTMYGNSQGLDGNGKPSLILQAANELARKFGGKTGSVSLSTGEQPALFITPEMRAKILNEGMPLFSYAGQRAANADKSALARAVEMEQQGIDNEAIRKETGWFLGMDDKWRFEIDDSNIKVKDDFIDQSVKNGKPVISSKAAKFIDLYSDFINEKGDGFVFVKDFIDAKELFDAYPEIANIPITIGSSSGSSGSYFSDGLRKQIELSKDVSSVDAFSIILHEIQHAIQDAEGWSRGGSKGSMSKSNFIKKDADEIKQVSDDIDKYKDLVGKTTADHIEIQKAILDLLEYKKILIKSAKYNAYESLAGEIEARDTQARMGMTAAQRRESTPYVSQGIAKEDAIVRFGSGIAESRTNNIDIKQKNDFLYSESEYGLVGGHIRDGALYIDYSEVDENQRGKGYGKQLYLALIDNALNKDLKVFSGSTVEQGAVNVYKSLVKNGYEVIDSRTGTLEDGSAYGKGAESPVFEVKKELAANLTQLFADLDQYKKGNLKNRIKAVQSLKDNPNKARIMFIDKNIIDLIGKLEKAGVEVNCK